ncbi:MAG TPA: adenosylcobalamin-dependent ribonucleoside-diphosphate reductase [Ktedonobacterales bacterium]|jgi:ribonucleoside-diphosphate reductase alpha chain
MELSANAIRVLEARYLRRDRWGKIHESPDELFARVAWAVAEGELLVGNAAHAALWEERFYRRLTSLDFLPNSPTLMNAGTPLGQLSACFVLPVEDTMESIFGALRNMALVQRTGGGTGYNFGRLRPAGDPLASTGGAASGPVSFMRIFDCATENIKLGGRRRGANMGILPVDHPDILEFIDAKRTQGELRNFNVSVGVTDAFMAALDADETYPLRHPADGRTVTLLSARMVFDRIVEAAWATGDPGLVFLDTIERANPTPVIGRIEATNPCGEVPLLPNESCNLGSINLAHFVIPRDGIMEIDWARLTGAVHEAVRFLDDVLLVNRYPLPEIEAASLGNRKIGLGIMGFAELLMLLGISYKRAQAVTIARQLMRFIASAARDASIALANERGVFPNWDRSIYVSSGVRLRNATRISIAPTGTISIIADTSSSIEPLFALCYRRVGVLGEQTLDELNPLFLSLGERMGFLTPAVLEHVRQHGTLANAPGVPGSTRELFATALDIAPRQHLLIQAAFQSAVDNAVAKTINLPEDASPERIAALYCEAFRLGLKGVTVYRYGSKAQQVLQLGADEAPYEREFGSKCDPYQCRL